MLNDRINIAIVDLMVAIGRRVRRRGRRRSELATPDPSSRGEWCLRSDEYSMLKSLTNRVLQWVRKTRRSVRRQPNPSI